MIEKRISLKEAVKFHGHLGPYLTLGLLAGELGVKKLAAKKYFGINLKVFGATRKPKSCLIDGLQLSSGATYGKGNIGKFNGRAIKITMEAMSSGRKITLVIKPKILQRLKEISSHGGAEDFARKLYNMPYSNIFILSTQGAVG